MKYAEVILMLIEFRFKNYRSFRDEAVLSMEATGLSSFKSCLIPLSSTVKLLPAIAIYGKNGGGKSNVIRAFWLAVQFIRNAQRTQHERAAIPVNPFALNDYSKDEPTEFAFEYTSGGVKYWYGFAATREKIYAEYLYHAPKGQKALVFKRTEQHFDFTEDKSKRALIGEMVAENQLFFSVACTMNDAACVAAMRWFRDQVFFSRDYTDFLKKEFKDVASIKRPSSTGLFEEADSKFQKDKAYQGYAEVTDEIWFFFDVETKDIGSWDARMKIIKRLRSLRKKPGIKVRLLMTTGCIEYWLMLHYDMYAPSIQTVA